MKFLIYIFLKLKENVFLTLILALQVFISLFSINTSIGQIQYLKNFTDIINKSNLKNSAYISFKSFDKIYTQNKEIKDEINSSLEKLNNLNKISWMTRTYMKDTKDNSNNIFDVVMYDDYIVQSVKLPISKGKWLNIDDNEKVNPVIINNSLAQKYSIGDEIKTVIVDKNITKEIILRVQGVLNKSGFFILFNGSGDEPSLSCLFSNEKNVILSRQLKTTDGDLVRGQKLPGAFLTVSNVDLKSETFIKWKDEVNDIAWVNTVENMVKKQEAITRDKLLQQQITNFILIILAICGLGGSNLLYSYKQMREYSICYLCGAKWTTCVCINACINLFVVFIPAILSYVLFIYQNYGNPNSIVIINKYNIYISILLVFILFSLTSIATLIKLYKSSPVLELRRHE